MVICCRKAKPDEVFAVLIGIGALSGAAVAVQSTTMSRQPATKTRRSVARQRPPERPRVSGKRLLWQASVVGLVLLTVLLIWLDALVRSRFDSHQWQLPARVYARPLELYVGRELSLAHLRQVLTLLQYREDSAARLPGSYSVNGNELLIHSRAFRDSDGGEQARLMRLTLSAGRVQALRQGNGQPLAVARLEPLQIGSIHPGHNQDRILVRLDQVPPLLVQMLIATEDRQFAEHPGISVRGLARAMLANLRAGRVEQGGSTLTQQLVKNFWLTRERSLWRKLVEMPMAILLELHYSKSQILETYLNQVYLGQDGNRAIHGMGLAAQFYFGRPLAELAPHQLALLVGMLKGPAYYDPRRRAQASRARRDLVIEVAQQQGLLSQSAAEQARARALDVIPKDAGALYAFPHFVDLVRRQLARDYPPPVLSSAGLIINSTLDVLAQLAAEQALANFLKPHQEINGAVIVAAPRQGDVLALVGDKQSRRSGFNRALDASRPIGSLAKPAVVLAALQQPALFHLGSLLEDTPLTVRMEDGKLWQPQNFDGESRGSLPLVEALASSRNQAIARLGMAVGLDRVIHALRTLGVQSPIPPYPSIFLGSVNLSPFETAVMYQTIATGGERTPLRAITDVLDAQGNPLARYPVRPERVMDESLAYLLQWALQQTIRDGTGRYAAARLPAEWQLAGKTGTSDGQRDAWFAGFSGSHLALVWLGRDDNASMPLTGSTGALRVWTELMATQPQRPLQLTLPAGVERVWLDASGDKRSAAGCAGAREYPLLLASIPTASSACGTVQSAPGRVKKWFQGWFD